MKALLIADTHWLWYAAGRWAGPRGISRPRVDYMELRNQTVRFIIRRFGHVYDLECCAFVVNRRQGGMERFIDLLRGFGYRVQECENPTPAVVEMLKTEPWDMVVLAVGSIEAFAATESARKEGRRVIVASFDKNIGADATMALDNKVLYEGGGRHHM